MLGKMYFVPQLWFYELIKSSSLKPMNDEFEKQNLHDGVDMKNINNILLLQISEPQRHQVYHRHADKMRKKALNTRCRGGWEKFAGEAGRGA